MVNWYGDGDDGDGSIKQNNTWLLERDNQHWIWNDRCWFLFIFSSVHVIKWFRHINNLKKEINRMDKRKKKLNDKAAVNIRTRTTTTTTTTQERKMIRQWLWQWQWQLWFYNNYRRRRRRRKKKRRRRRRRRPR